MRLPSRSSSLSASLSVLHLAFARYVLLPLLRPPLIPNAQGYLEARGVLPPGHPMGSSMRSGQSGVSSGMSEASYDPPRIHGVDTASRPPLVVHATTPICRPAWIGVRY
jgi:hypothetical protein